MKRLLVLAAALAIWPAAMRAQVPVAVETSGELRAVLDLKGDPVRGKAAFRGCGGCHRQDASGRSNRAIPRLSGQHASVIIKQLVDIRAGRRINPPMKPIVDDPDLSLQALADIASYLEGLPILVIRGKGPGTGAARGAVLFTRDCAGCHGGNGEGRAETIQPMVAAQHYSYLLRELDLIRDGGRGNSDAAMVELIRTYSQTDLQDVADYMSQLPPPVR